VKRMGTHESTFGDSAALRAAHSYWYFWRFS
jgi:hypothetical protein